MPVHGFQYPIAAALDRTVEVMTYLVAASNNVYEAVSAVLGVRGHEFYAELTFKPVKAAEQLRKINIGAITVGIDILSEEQDILIAVLHKGFYFGNNILRTAGTFPAPYIRNYTVGAEIVAAVHYGNAGFERTVTCYRQALCDNAVTVGNIKYTSSLKYLGKKYLGKFMQDMRAENYIYKRKSIFQALCGVLLLHHTAAYCNYQLGIFLFQVLERTYIAENSFYCIFPYSTGIEQDKIGIGGVVSERVAHFRQHSLDTLAVTDILLTAVAVDVGKGRGLFYVEDGAYLLHIKALLLQFGLCNGFYWQKVLPFMLFEQRS